MRILVTGATGLIGRALCQALAREGAEVVALVRLAQGPEERGAVLGDPTRTARTASLASTSPEGRAAEPWWNPDQRQIELGSQAFTAVIHLAGESIAGRWAKAKKARIRRSRVEGTRLLSAALARLAVRPKVLLSASAIGFYGDGGEAWLDEASPPGQGFLAEVCREWEEATDAARQAGIRVVHLRLGMVLAAEGGALAQMRPMFRAGLGGPLGSGEQFWSWIALPDVIGAIRHVLQQEELRGPVNLVAPAPERNAAFTAALASVLGRPAVLPVPAWVLRLALGEMGQAVLMASARVRPSQLLASGYTFQFPELKPALERLIAPGSASG